MAKAHAPNSSHYYIPHDSPWPIRGSIALFAIMLANRDRKSTRLNSSHLVISYAVFCLKKKKKTNIHLKDLFFILKYVPNNLIHVPPLNGLALKHCYNKIECNMSLLSNTHILVRTIHT